jgi:hypothetical protein
LVYPFSGWAKTFKHKRYSKIKMKRKPLLIVLFVGLALHLPCAAVSSATQGNNPIQQARAASTLQQSTPAVVPRHPFKGSTGAPDDGRLPGDGNLPEAASALPLLSAIGAGALLGGLLSARRTRSEK